MGESESMLLSPQDKEANGEFAKDKEDDNDSMLLSPHPRPRTVTCISAPEDSSPSTTRQRSVTSPYSSRPRLKSIRNQAGIVSYRRSNSVISRNGRRIYKNLGRMHSIDYHEPEEFQTTVRLFRLNSFVKDTGRKEDAEAEPERQQWDNPMEFLLSCISMSVGLGNVWRFPFTAYENGGGAFLIPYLVVLVLIGLAVFYLAASCQATLPWTLCHPELQEPGLTCVPSTAATEGNRTELPGLNKTV